MVGRRAYDWDAGNLGGARCRKSIVACWLMRTELCRRLAVMAVQGWVFEFPLIQIRMFVPTHPELSGQAQGECRLRHLLPNCFRI